MEKWLITDWMQGRYKIHLKYQAIPKKEESDQNNGKGRSKGHRSPKGLPLAESRTNNFNTRIVRYSSVLQTSEKIGVSPFR